ncbi:MAG: DUF177 domain-containing protein [Stappiaceae bacterium]
MTQSTNPLSRPFNVEELSNKGSRIVVTASPQEMEAIVRAAALEAMESFQVRFELRPWRKTGVKIVGELEADVTQKCVVTLEPLATSMSEEFSITVVPLSEAEKYRVAPNEEGEIEFDLESIEPPEFFEGSTIDLGVVAMEQFMLMLDPYPKAEGVEFPSFTTNPEGIEAADDRPPSPFSVLSKLKKPN